MRVQKKMAHSTGYTTKRGFVLMGNKPLDQIDVKMVIR
jgi:hypothetical protein